MRTRGLAPLLISVFLLLLTLSLAADSPENMPLSLYLGDGKMLTASVKQITMNAQVPFFEYSPNGQKIAYPCLEHDQYRSWITVNYVETWRSVPSPISLMKSKSALLTGDADSTEPDGKELIVPEGWSGDGRYLLVRQVSYGISDPDQSGVPQYTQAKTRFYCWDLESSPRISHIIPLPTDDQLQISPPLYAWSPDHGKILFETVANDSTANVQKPWCAIYDPATGSLQKIDVADGLVMRGWFDDTHLMLVKRSQKPKGMVIYSLDLQSGVSKVVSAPKGGFPLETLLAETHLPYSKGDVDGLPDPKNANLQIDTVKHVLAYGVKGPSVPASTLWIHRAKGLPKSSLLAMGTIPGNEPSQAAWSPEGDSIAYLSGGSLMLANLVQEDATLNQKIAAGDPLNCEEQAELATFNLKEIGLGLIQYSQDYDERLPPSAGVNDAIYPYIKTYEVFSVGDSKFAYYGTGQAMTDVQNPSDTIIGRLDTLCNKNVLYLDGHIKSFPR